MRHGLRRVLTAALVAVVVAIGIAPLTAFAADGAVASAPTASGTNFFGNGTPITITGEAPEGATLAIFEGFTATGNDAYISWAEGEAEKYLGVSEETVSVYGGKDGSSEPVSVPSTSITMTGGRIRNLYGGNLGAKGYGQDSLSVVEGDVNISLSGTADVYWLLHGGGALNTCVKGTVRMSFDGVVLSKEGLYVNGGVYGNGNEGKRNIEDGSMDTYAVANNVVIEANDSKFSLICVGGSGSTKVASASMTLTGCSAENVYLGGINGEVQSSKLVLIGCHIYSLAGTNRGFVGSAEVTISDSTVDSLSTGAAPGCFSSDSGTPDGSGITGSVSYAIDDQSTVSDATLTPSVKRDQAGYEATVNNVTISKEGDPLKLAVEPFEAVQGDQKNTVSEVVVPEGSVLSLSNAEVELASGQTLLNSGAISMDDASRLTVPAGSSFGNAGTIVGAVVAGEGALQPDYAAITGSKGYETLQDAIDAAADGAKVTLLGDVTEDVTVAVGNNITLDLNGFTLTNSSGHTITNNGTLTIQDSLGGGVVDNVTHVKGALVNHGTVTVQSGTFTRSHEAGSSPSDNGGNSWYVIDNQGTMTFNGGSVKSTGKYSSLIRNLNGTLNINDGQFENGFIALKNDDGGTLNISGGTIVSGDQAVQNWNDATIAGGELKGDVATWSYGKQSAKTTISGGEVDGSVKSISYSGDARSQVSITGGSVTGEIMTASYSSGVVPDDEANESSVLNVSGGTFEKTPLAYVVDDSAVRINDDGSFTAVTRDGNLPAGTYVVPDGANKLTAEDFQDGLSITVDENGNVVASRPYVPPVAAGDAVKVEQSEGGKVSVSPSRADEGDEVTVTVIPEDGQELRGLTVTDEDGNAVEVRAGEKDGEFVFTMPDGDVTVSAEFGCDGGVSCPTHGFADVDQSQWYHDAVDWAVTNGVLNGYGDGGELVGPLNTITRAEMAQVLWNKAGRPAAEADLSGFADVDAEGWYADPVAWCLSEGIFRGYGDTFGTERPISREEVATVLWRLSGEPEPSTDLSSFSDAESVSEYATDALAWAVESGVVTGKDDGTKLDPQGVCTRAEAAAMLMRLSAE